MTTRHLEINFINGYEKFAAFPHQIGDLSGLQVLPLGLLLLFVSIPILGVDLTGNEWAFFLPLIISSVLIWVCTSFYYNHTIGKFEPLPPTKRQFRIRFGLHFGIAILFPVLFEFLEKVMPNLSITLMVLLVAAGIIIEGRKYNRTYYTWAGIISTVFAILPIFAGDGFNQPILRVGGFVYFCFLGLATIAIGLLDNRRLLQAFHALGENSFGNLVGDREIPNIIGDEANRLALLATLSGCESASYRYLMNVHRLTLDRLTGYIVDLQEPGWVWAEGVDRGKVPPVKIGLTEAGREAVERHWGQLTALREAAAEAGSSSIVEA